MALFIDFDGASLWMPSAGGRRMKYGPKLCPPCEDCQRDYPGALACQHPLEEEE